MSQLRLNPQVGSETRTGEKAKARSISKRNQENQPCFNLQLYGDSTFRDSLPSSKLQAKRNYPNSTLEQVQSTTFNSDFQNQSLVGVSFLSREESSFFSVDELQRQYSALMSQNEQYKQASSKKIFQLQEIQRVKANQNDAEFQANLKSLITAVNEERLSFQTATKYLKAELKQADSKIQIMAQQSNERIKFQHEQINSLKSKLETVESELNANQQIIKELTLYNNQMLQDLNIYIKEHDILINEIKKKDQKLSEAKHLNEQTSNQIEKLKLDFQMELDLKNQQISYQYQQQEKLQEKLKKLQIDESWIQKKDIQDHIIIELEQEVKSLRIRIEQENQMKDKERENMNQLISELNQKNESEQESLKEQIIELQGKQQSLEKENSELLSSLQQNNLELLDLNQLLISNQEEEKNDKENYLSQLFLCLLELSRARQEIDLLLQNDSKANCGEHKKLMAEILKLKEVILQKEDIIIEKEVELESLNWRYDEEKRMKKLFANNSPVKWEGSQEGGFQENSDKKQNLSDCNMLSEIEEQVFLIISQNAKGKRIGEHWQSG